MKHVLICLSLIISLSLPFLGQQPPNQSSVAIPQKHPNDEDVVRITTNLVQIDAVVTDGSGKQVTDLSDQDFEVLEDGRPQKITNISYVAVSRANSSASTRVVPNDKNSSPVPVRLWPEQVHRTIALVVDDLGLSFESTVYVKRALRKFVDEQMESGDLVAIVRTRAGTGALQQFTGDKRLLYAAIDRLHWFPAGSGHVSAFEPISLDPLERLRARAAASIPGAGPSSADSSGYDEIEQFRQDIFSVGTLGALKFIIKGMQPLPGRKTVVLVSDGITIFPSVTRESAGGVGEQGSSRGARRRRDQDSPRVIDALRTLVDFANRSSVVVYSLDARGLQTLGATAVDNSMDMDDPAAIAESGRTANLDRRLMDRSVAYFNSQDGLNYLAQQTGGFFIHDTNDLAGGIARILDDQNGYYLIGYRPDDSTFDAAGHPSFHHLEVRVKREGVKVRARTGFYGVTDEEIRSAPVSGEQRIAEALVSPFAPADVRLRLTCLFGSEPSVGPIMRALLHIDGRDLTFKETPEGWHQLSFEIAAFTFGDSGVVSDKLAKTESMRVRDEAYRMAQLNGLIYTLNVPIQKPGAYQLRIAVRDMDSNRVGSASEFIEVPDLKKGQLALSGIVIAGIDSNETKKVQMPQKAPGISPAAAPTIEAIDPQASPAVRRLRGDMTLEYAYNIFNPRLDKRTHRPQLQTQIRVFRDNVKVYESKKMPSDAMRGTDVASVASVGTLRLSNQLEPGDYFLQLVVTDLLADAKHNTVSSWIDFEITQ